MTNFNIDGVFGTGDHDYKTAGIVRVGLSFDGRMPRYNTLASFKSNDNEFTR